MESRKDDLTTEIQELTNLLKIALAQSKLAADFEANNDLPPRDIDSPLTQNQEMIDIAKSLKIQLEKMLKYLEYLELNRHDEDWPSKSKKFLDLCYENFDPNIMNYIQITKYPIIKDRLENMALEKIKLYCQINEFPEEHPILIIIENGEKQNLTTSEIFENLTQNISDIRANKNQFSMFAKKNSDSSDFLFRKLESIPSIKLSHPSLRLMLILDLKEKLDAETSKTNLTFKK